jgi:hypothetical protein
MRIKIEVNERHPDDEQIEQSGRSPQIRTPAISLIFARNIAV